jgi:hypothetical protein
VIIHRESRTMIRAGAGAPLSRIRPALWRTPVSGWGWTSKAKPTTC